MSLTCELLSLPLPTACRRAKVRASKPQVGMRKVPDAILRALLHQDRHEVTHSSAIESLVLLRHDLFDLGTLDAGILLRETVDNFLSDGDG